MVEVDLVTVIEGVVVEVLAVVEEDEVALEAALKDPSLERGFVNQDGTCRIWFQL